MSFGIQELFKNINLYIGETEKIGIVGVNGAGKTTFFKIIMGSISPDNGKVIIEKKARVKWLPQVLEDHIFDTSKIGKGKIKILYLNKNNIKRFDE